MKWIIKKRYKVRNLKDKIDISNDAKSNIITHYILKNLSVFAFLEETLERGNGIHRTHIEFSTRYYYIYYMYSGTV